MKTTAPHFLLLTRASSNEGRTPGGQWSFILEQTGDTRRIEVADEEPDVQGERLDLLAVVRGLEALDQPSRVTLITPSSYVGRGFRSGLKNWIEEDFKYKRFNEMVPIKDRDLWKRVAGALQFHTVDCRVWQFESSRSPARRLKLPSLINPPAAYDMWNDAVPGRAAFNAQPAISVDTAGCADMVDVACDAGSQADVIGSGVIGSDANEHAVGQHAAKAGIVYRHYAANATSRNIVRQEPIELDEVSGESAAVAQQAAVAENKPDPIHVKDERQATVATPREVVRPRQVDTDRWASITSRIAEHISDRKQFEPFGAMAPA